MAAATKKVFLFYGDNDYLVFKELKELRKNLASQNVSVSEFDGSKSLDFKEIYSALHSDDLFLSSSAVILRDVSDGKSFFPFVEKLTDYLNSKESSNNELYIFHSGKVLKTSKFFKAVTKVGKVTERPTPKPQEILDVITKSIPIKNDAAELMIEYSNSNLFQIRNEISKLKTYLVATGNKEITIKDVEELCYKPLGDNEAWGVGSLFLKYTISKEPADKKKLLDEVEHLFDSEVASMQILYSCYQYVLNAIKLKVMVSRGKNYRDCMALGYFFVKDFFDKRDKLKHPELLELNSKLLDYEYGVKSGEIDDVSGLRRLLVNL